MEKKEQVGKGCFKSKSVGEKQEFRVTVGSYWLSCRGGQLLVGDATHTFPWGAGL